MKLSELVGEIAKNNPKSLAGVSEKKAAAIVRAAFEYIAETVANSTDEVVKIPGLGQFRARQVEREVDGETVVKRQVIFRPAKPKSETAGAQD